MHVEELIVGRLTRGVRGALPPLLLVVALVALWELAVRGSGTPDYLLPTPYEIAQETVRDAGPLAAATRVTVVEIAVGFVASVTAALAFATAIHFSAAVRKALLPLLVLSQTVPTVVFAPLLTIMLGYALAPKVAIVAIICFFPIVVAAVDGFAAVEEAPRDLMRSLGAGPVTAFRKLILPAALPQIFSGARVAATYAAVGAVFAEWAGSSAGLGFVMLQAQPSLETARVFAAALLLCLLALVLFAAVTALEHLLVPRKGRIERA